MCYEMSGWFRKARAPEQQRKDVPAEKTAKQSTTSPAPKVAEPEKRTTERDKIPA